MWIVYTCLCRSHVFQFIYLSKCAIKNYKSILKNTLYKIWFGCLIYSLLTVDMCFYNDFYKNSDNKHKKQDIHIDNTSF